MQRELVATSQKPVGEHDGATVVFTSGHFHGIGLSRVDAEVVLPAQVDPLTGLVEPLALASGKVALRARSGRLHHAIEKAARGASTPPLVAL